MKKLKVTAYQLDYWADVINVQIERVIQLDGSSLWAIREKGFCLNKDGEWEYEPMPSTRDHRFLARCRFISAEKAHAIWVSKKCKSRFEHYRERANSNYTAEQGRRTGEI